MKQKLLLAANVAGLMLVLLVAAIGKVSYSALMRGLAESISNTTASVGVIGGADGPTAIFVSGGFDLKTTAMMLLLSLMLTGIFFLLNIIHFLKEN